MTTATHMPWAELLRAISERLIEVADEYDVELLATREPEMLRTRWLGARAASEPEIAAREAALGVALPAEYRAFLRASDGFRGLAGFPHGLCSLDPVAKIDWFRTRDRDIGRIDSIRENLADGIVHPDWDVDADEVEAALLIGESDGNECVLLAPPTTARGWEVWTYHPECGFGRCPSFRQFMEDGLTHEP